MTEQGKAPAARKAGLFDGCMADTAVISSHEGFWKRAWSGIAYAFTGRLSHGRCHIDFTGLRPRLEASRREPPKAPLKALEIPAIPDSKG